MSAQTAARAWAYLSAVAEPPCRELAALVAAVGAEEAAQRVRRGAIPSGLAERTAARRDIDTAATDLENLDRRGGRLVTPGDEEWPHLAFASFCGAGLSAKPNGIAPLALWAIGPRRLDEIHGRSAAIVGTRAATPYGEHVAGELAAGLAAHDVGIVSGGATVL